MDNYGYHFPKRILPQYTVYRIPSHNGLYYNSLNRDLGHISAIIPAVGLFSASSPAYTTSSYNIKFYLNDFKGVPGPVTVFFELQKYYSAADGYS